MNTKPLIALVIALLGSACASAQSAGPLTRAEVIAELYRARAAGEICANEAECDQSAAHRGLTQRGQTLDAPDAGRRNVHICQNEAECAAAPARTFAVTRAEVRAELYRARAAGEIAETEADNDIGRAAPRRKTN
jgi:hypothetical protein